MANNYPPNILSMVQNLRKEAVTRVAVITRNVMAPLVTLLRFFFSFLSVILNSVSSSLGDVGIPLKFERAMIVDLSISMSEISSIQSVLAKL